MSDKELNVLYEDNHIIVVLKPQGVPSCPDESKDLDMLTIIKQYVKQKENKPGNVYVGLVHRLDRVTGGVMVYAKSSKAATRLAEQMKLGDFKKQYMTVVCGKLKEPKAILTNYLRKNAVTNTVYACTESEKDAKLAQLDYELLQQIDVYNLLKVNLHTGRSHQIRVQFSCRNLPVYGDMKYGKEYAKKGNLALWATLLSFTHPVTKERLVFKVEPDKEILPWKNFDIDCAFDKF